LFPDGVYYLDFNNAYNQKDIQTVFKNVGIEYLLNENNGDGQKDIMKND